MHLYDRVPFPILAGEKAQCFMDPCVPICNEKNFKLVYLVSYHLCNKYKEDCQVYVYIRNQ